MRFILNIVGRHIALIIALGVLWLCLSGEEHWGNTVLSIFGIASILVTIGLANRAGVLDKEGVPTSVFPGIIKYMLWLTLEIGKANVAVVGHVLKPKLTLSPKMMKIPTHQPSDLGKVIFANSITLTPGTVSIDLHEDYVIVHALTEELADVDGIMDMGARVCAIDGPEGRAKLLELENAREVSQ